MTPAQRIEQLVRSGSVDTAEGERLLAALHARPASSRWQLVLRPFDRIGGGTAALLGLVISALGVLVARSGVRFDGFLDLHLPQVAPTLGTALVDQVVAWLLPSALFFAYARFLKPHARLLDHVGMVGFARLPLLLAAVLLLLLAPAQPGDLTRPSPRLVVVGVLTLVFVVLNLTLLFQGFKSASGLAGTRLVAGFIGLLVVAELASKVVLSVLG